MQNELQKIVGIAAILIVADAALPSIFLFGVPWTGVLLNVYLAVGAGLVLYFSAQELLRRDASRQAFETLVLKINAPPRTGFERIADKFYVYMIIVVGVVCWPTQFGLQAFRRMPIFHRTNSPFGAGAAMNLYPFETSISVYVALAPAVLTLLAARHGPPFLYSIDFLWLIAGTIFLRHLGSLISGTQVQARLRGALDPVAVNYALIAIGDLVGLILCYDGITHWNNGAIFSLQEALQTFRQLLAFKGVIEVFEQPLQSPIVYCIGASGLLWWLSLAQGLLQIKEYRRQPIDYLRIAANCMILGKDDKVVAMLEAAKAASKEEYLIKGQLHAARKEFDKATPLVRRAFRQMEIPETDNYILLQLFGGLVSFRVGQEVFHEFLDFAATHGMTELPMTGCINSYCQLGGDGHLLADRFLAGPHVRRYPLAAFFLKWGIDEERDILAAFAAAEPKTPGPDRALWLCLEALIWLSRRLTDLGFEAFIARWPEQSLEEIREIGIAMSDDVEKIHLVDLLHVVAARWSNCGFTFPALAPVSADIQKSLPDNEMTLKVKAAWEGFAPAPILPAPIPPASISPAGTPPTDLSPPSLEKEQA